MQIDHEMEASGTNVTEIIVLELLDIILELDTFAWSSYDSDIFVMENLILEVSWLMLEFMIHWQYVLWWFDKLNFFACCINIYLSAIVFVGYIILVTFEGLTTWTQSIEYCWMDIEWEW